jgi:hypothetical protein
MNLNTTSLALSAAAAFLLTACGAGRAGFDSSQRAAPVIVAAARPTTVVATVPEPPGSPAQMAAPGPSPGSDYIYVNGYYNWRGNGYEWVPGAWVKTPNPGSTWVPGAWQPTRGGYMWVPGHWQ